MMKTVLGLLIITTGIIPKTEEISIQTGDKRSGIGNESESMRKATGKPLYLTPLINEGKIAKAKTLSRVKNLSSKVISFSGYLTVNEQFNSNLFFWFFPATQNPLEAPVMTWLQGGPGASSLFGLFVGNGPFRVNKNKKLKLNPFAWTLTHSVLYFDSPVGTGFSFTDEGGYVKSSEETARHLYIALTQFFTLFPEYVPRDFYIAGESYAGKFVPALAIVIHRENQKEPKVRINLKGIAIGNGFTDPINMFQTGTYLYNHGLIDEKARDYFHKQENAIRNYIRKKKWTKAFEIQDAFSGGDFVKKTYFEQVTGYMNDFNTIQSDDPPEIGYYLDFIQKPRVRRAIHVGNKVYHGFINTAIVKGFIQEYCQTAVPWLLEVLEAREGYRVLIYSGNLDISVPITGTEQMLRKMHWSGASEYAQASFQKWRVGPTLAGYVREAKRLTFIVVRNAGHFVPYDQSEASYDMINRFTSGKKFT